MTRKTCQSGAHPEVQRTRSRKGRGTLASAKNQLFPAREADAAEMNLRAFDELEASLDTALSSFRSKRQAWQH